MRELSSIRSCREKSGWGNGKKPSDLPQGATDIRLIVPGGSLKNSHRVLVQLLQTHSLPGTRLVFSGP